MPWRLIYQELKRLEFRGEVRRGYFVAGLAGAQFALHDAVESLREPAGDEVVALTVADPANVLSLPLGEGVERDPLSRPRSASAVLVTIAGVVVLTAEGRGKRLRIREGGDPGTVSRALHALVARMQGPDRHGRRRDIVVETINGEPAATSPLAGMLLDAGFRRHPGGFRYYATAPTA